MQPTQDLRVKGTIRLISPRALKNELPTTDAANEIVVEARQVVQNIIDKKDDRLLAIVGPCSIHDVAAAKEYASKLAKLHKELKDKVYILMRVYFEKPRTTIGWKGFINDPHLDDSYDMQFGLRAARQLLTEITEMGLPTATEFLDPITPQYIDDLVSWAAIGARTIESQTHREMASGLSMPVGFKNSTDGRLQVAIDAMRSAMHPHNFLGIDQDGKTSIIQTTGNSSGHIVLRGGSSRPNYDPESINEAADKLQKADLAPAVMVDCSHANSGKKYERQEPVWQSILDLFIAGNPYIIGMMLESHLKEGNQPIPADLSKLIYGVSITDECISWETTERLLRESYKQLSDKK
ncbi:phospho-2-dehydro-3-deoxyheptonate aldolase [Chloroherpeton thalassium ATCC 35110]|uniref:Phospho-2-dehydro-3-deoxyheptonate aldolase n=1 Tax=Chloroherpeton thalassium (strain ATCC 35110 / GB-78) TaxID=517418 RepID=B3QV11_CHLT3|nr:3-deoxy-7-phosphoheptulonate synthase [Chloroherpeton thalassium]ACF14512.1 phospho-2-dehydro-3-deoxyheptonate aldolase [Chloroherpeton thalassium ATCC 35110]